MPSIEEPEEENIRAGHLAFAFAMTRDENGLTRDGAFDRHNPSAASEVLESELARMLFQAFGKPNEVKVATEKGSGGEYLISQDTLVVGAGSEGVTAVFEVMATFCHEMAHVWQARQGEAIGRAWAEAKVPKPKIEHANYASKHVIEQQAEAFSAAVGILAASSNKGVSDSQIYSILEAAEEAAPGTGLMIRIVLGHPVAGKFFSNAHRSGMGGPLEIQLAPEANLSASERRRRVNAAAMDPASAAFRLYETVEAVKQKARTLLDGKVR